MDPREQSQSEEETIRAKSGSVYRRAATVTPTQAAEETTTVSKTPTGETTRRVTRAGTSPISAREYTQKKRIFHTYQILWYVLGFIEIVLAFRFVLKLAGANPQSGFADFVYNLSYPFAAPFLGLFSSSTGQGAETIAVIEWSTIVGGIVYVLVVWGIIKLIQIGKPTQPEDVERTIAEQ